MNEAAGYQHLGLLTAPLLLHPPVPLVLSDIRAVSSGYALPISLAQYRLELYWNVISPIPRSRLVFHSSCCSATIGKTQADELFCSSCKLALDSTYVKHLAESGGHEAIVLGAKGHDVVSRLAGFFGPADLNPLAAEVFGSALRDFFIKLDRTCLRLYLDYLEEYLL